MTISGHPERPGRTEARAREIIERIRAETVQDIADDDARAILTEGFVSSILDVAWRFQFEADRTVSRARVRQLVSDAIERRSLGDDK